MQNIRAENKYWFDCQPSRNLSSHGGRLSPSTDRKPPSHSATPELLTSSFAAYEICGLGYLCRKLLAFCLCEIFELLFRHGLSHLFRRAFQAGFLAFATFRR
jgi:hypothetical protein